MHSASDPLEKIGNFLFNHETLTLFFSARRPTLPPLIAPTKTTGNRLKNPPSTDLKPSKQTVKINYNKNGFLGADGGGFPNLLPVPSRPRFDTIQHKNKEPENADHEITN